MADFGTLEKLLILAYDEPDYSGSPSSTFTALVNPNEITMSYEIEYDSAQGSGTTDSRMEFKSFKPGDLSLNFLLDGTGANGTAIDVQAQIELFQAVTGYSGTIHRTNYLLVQWGTTLPLVRCVLKSASIAYKLFTSAGVPLRAVISAVFTGNSDDETRVAEAGDESSDLIHVRWLKAGENLSSLCYSIYGDPLYYLDVARVNRIDNFRNIAPGTKIFFPPLEA
jgi:hypothetical protein